MVNEDDEWSTGGRNILAPDILATLKTILEQQPVILEHWFYYGSRAPNRVVFDNFDDLQGYLKSNARPGDAFYAWSYSDLCRDDNSIAGGKYPDEKGRTPKRGAY